MDSYLFDNQHSKSNSIMFKYLLSAQHVFVKINSILTAELHNIITISWFFWMFNFLEYLTQISASL